MPGVIASAEAVAALRRLYDIAVEAQVVGLTPEQAMVYRHACGLAWNRTNLTELAIEAAAGRLPYERLIERMAPHVREALAYVSSGAPDSSGIH